MAQVQLKGKLLIGAVLTVKTGLHIGDSSDFAPIGAVDSPFIRDPLTKAPIIPGSSLKGKMRTLLAKVLDEKVEEDGKISLPKPEKDETVVARLFGISSDTETRPARLQFRDAFIKEESRNKFKNLDTDTYLGEIKAENNEVHYMVRTQDKDEKEYSVKVDAVTGQALEKGEPIDWAKIKADRLRNDGVGKPFTLQEEPEDVDADPTKTLK